MFELERNILDVDYNVMYLCKLLLFFLRGKCDLWMVLIVIREYNRW